MHEKNYWDASDYAENSSVQTIWAKDFINNRMHLQNTKRLLDIGCGDGRITAYLSELLPQATIIGVDPSEEMIALADSRPHRPNLSFIQGMGERYSAPSPQDIIVSFSCFHWIPDQKQLAAQLASNLNREGTLYFLCAPNVATNVNIMLKAATQLPQWKERFKNFTDHLYLQTPDFWRQALSDAGFSPQRVDIVTHPVKFPSLDKFSDWVAAWAPQVRHLPLELRQAYMKDVMDLYLKAHPDKNPSDLVYDDRMLEVEAKKK